MPRKSKKRARQIKRRAERREVRGLEMPEPTPAERLLERIRQEAARRHRLHLQKAALREAEVARRYERDKARGKR